MAYGDGLRRNRCGVWCWRWVVPADVRHVVGSGELLRSLSTASRRQAVLRSLPWRLDAAAVVRHVREGLPMPNDALLRLIDKRQIQVLKAELDEADQRAEQARLVIEKLSEERVQLQQQLIASQEVALRAGAAGVPVVTAQLAAPAGPLLSVAIDEFLREGQAGEKWTEKTAERWGVTFRNLKECLGDRAIGTISRADCMDFFERLKRLPANANKKAELTGKSFRELTDAPLTGFEPLSPGTVNDHMTRISGFFKWARLHHSLPTNPAQGLQIKKVKPAGRVAFTEEELLRLFGTKMWTERTFLHPHYYWIMLLGLHTGARLNELCQLRLTDFVEVNGVPTISISDEAEDDGAKRVKNDNARRRVPVHPELIRLGLLRWVESRRKAGGVNLFDELKPGRDGHGQAVSKWFAKYRKACGITETQSKVFHSFRNGFVSRIMNAGAEDYKVAHIVGHEIGTVAGDVYWTDRNAGELLRVVSLFTLPEAVLALIPVVEDVQFLQGARNSGKPTKSTRRP